MRRLLGRAAAVALMAAACRLSGEPLSSPDPARRAAAVSRLAASRGDADVPALLVAQDDPSALVRKAAAGAFAARGGPASVEALGKLVADPDPEVAGAAARALSALPAEPRAKELLVAAYPAGSSAARLEIASALKAVGGSLRDAVELEARLTWERDVLALERGTPAERAGAAEDLGRSGRAEAVRLLAPLLDRERGEGRRVVAAAARGLGAAGLRTARPALERLLEAAPDVEVAAAAAEALGDLADPAVAGALAVAGAADAARLGPYALDALAALPPVPEVAAALCHLAARAQDPAVASRAAALAREREGECPEKPLLARVSRRGTDPVSALAALAELRPTAEIEKAHLERLLASPEAAVRASAARALGGLGRGEVGRLAACLADPDERVWTTAAEALGRIGPPAVPALSRAAAEARPDDRRRLTALARALGETGSPDAVPALKDLSRGAAAASAASLGRIGTQDAKAALVALLARPGALGRVEAIEALGSLGAGEAAPAIAGELTSDRPDVRAAAARALGRLRHDDAAAWLQALRSDYDAQVRRAAMEAVAKLPSARAR